MPVENQVAITLWQFRRFGNGATLQQVANWAGCGKGTVDLVTRCVMTAVLCPTFLNEFIRLPTPPRRRRMRSVG